MTMGRRDGERRCGRRRACGFTMVELLFGLAITALAALAVASMMTVVSTGASARADLTRTNLKDRVIASRLNAAIRSASMVLALTDDALVLWTGETRANGMPDLSEIIRIEYDEEAQELWSYAAPAELPAEEDRQYELGDDFEQVTANLRGTDGFPGQRWGSGVLRWSPSLDGDDVRTTTLVSHVLQVGVEETVNTSHYVAHLRSR